MPVFNRVRIINIRYDNREISDEMFNYYDGCNALMNLANGNGKTVIVETLFQPIRPNMSIGKWKITDYLTGDQHPSFVMIEWLLDNTKDKTYFTTGICMSVTRIEQEDAQPIRSLKYFTFTHTYTQGNAFDIKNIPLLPEKNGNAKYPTYDEIWTLLKKYNKQHPEFSLFRKQEQKDYQVHLRQHNIFPEEWALLETVNQAENGGGMGKLFESCTTSDLLFERWILKKISDTHREQRSTLMDALTNLTRPMIASDQKLREKKQAENIAEQLKKFEQVFHTYTDALDRKEQQERRLAGMLLHTEICYKNKEQEMARAQNEQTLCNEEEKHIRLEQLSEQYHNLTAKLQTAEEKVRLLKSQMPEYEEKAENARKARRLMQAAEYMSGKKYAEQKLQTARNQQLTLERGNAAQRLQDLGYTLHTGYKRAVENASGRYLKLQERLRELSCEQKECKKKQKELSEKKSTLIKHRAKAEQKLEQLETQLSDYQVKIGKVPETNIIGELLPESVQEIHDDLNIELEKANNRVKDIEQQKQQTVQELKLNQEAQEKSDIQIDENQAELIRQDTLWKSYQQQIEQMTKILSGYDIDGRFLYEKEDNLIRIKELYSNLQAELDKAKQQLTQTEDKLEKLRNDCLHTAPQFAKILLQNGISFQTGESYLKQQNPEFQKQLLSQNELLPYCYLVSDADYDKVLTIPEDAFSDRLCPVLRKRDIDFDMKRAANLTELGKIRFYSLYDRESMDPETRENYGQKLTQRRETLRSEIRKYNEQLTIIQSDISEIEKFTLTKQTVDELQHTLHETEEHRTKLLQERNELKSKNKMLNSRYTSLCNEFESAKQNVQQVKQKLSDFAEYIKLSAKATQEHQEVARFKHEEDQVEQDIHTCEKHMDELNETCQQLRIKQSDAEHDRNDAQKQVALYEQYSTGELLTEELEQLKQLEMEYQPLYLKQDKTRKELDEICRQSRKTITYNEEQLFKRFPDLKEAEIPLSFDATRLTELEQKEEYEKDILVRYQRDTEKAEYKVEMLNEELQKTDHDIQQAGIHEPLPIQQIKGNYAQRIEENNVKKNAANLLENTARKELKELLSRRTTLEKLVDSRILQDRSLTPVAEKTDIVSECLDFNAKKADAEKKLQHMKYVYTELQKDSVNKDNWITNVLPIRFEDCETYESCYYLYEQLNAKEKMLQDEISILRSELSNIENNRMHIIRQIYEHAAFLTKQIQDISSNSFVTLQGKRRKTLEIVFPEVSDSQAEQRIANLTDEVTLHLRERFTAHPEEENKLYDAICSCYSDLKIFHTYTNLQTVQIRVLKILQDERNSRLEKWESRYSGGERFITYFIAYSALADYTRRQATANQKGSIRSVFLVDNPFGEASSEHLVKSLIEITKKFRTQLICLSDLKQSSITNNFDLIYQLSMRKALYSNKSHLHTDNLISHTENTGNNKLEFVSLKSQLTFFDD